MKLYERIENNNFDEIDKNRAIELIEGGNGHLVYNENYFKLQKENEELKDTNCLVKRYFKLKDTNTYLQKENDELKKQRNIEPILINNKMYFIDNEIYNELLEDIKSNYTSVQKVKDKIEEIQKEYNKLDKQVDEYINDVNKDLPKYYENKEKIGIMQTLVWVIDNLQELLEGRE